MNFCPNCGFKVESQDAESCPSCGFVFKKTSDAASAAGETTENAAAMPGAENYGCSDGAATEAAKAGAETVGAAGAATGTGAATGATAAGTGAAYEYSEAVTVEPAPTYKTNGFAVASLVLGIIAFFGDFLFFIPSILAIIFAVIGMVKVKTCGNGKGMAIAGLVLGIVALLITVIISVMFFSMVGFVLCLPEMIVQ